MLECFGSGGGGLEGGREKLALHTSTRIEVSFLRKQFSSNLKSDEGVSGRTVLVSEEELEGFQRSAQFAFATYRPTFAPGGNVDDL